MSPVCRHRYRVVDVFTQVPLEGNPLAVFPDAANLDGVLMQRIAKELNLSETVFVLPSSREDCAARVRIFTPTRELKFAGHPTVGTAFVLMDEGIVPAAAESFALEEGVGPVPIRLERGERPLIWLRTPPIEWGQRYDPTVWAAALSLEPADLLPVDPQGLSAGNATVFIALKDRDAVDRASPDLQRLQALHGTEDSPLCIFVFAPTPEGAYSRMFAPEYGIVEDPATGSCTGPLAAYMMQHGLVSGEPGFRFVSEQGTKMGRRSLLHVQIHGRNGADGIEVGGHVVPVAEAAMELEGC